MGVEGKRKDKCGDRMLQDKRQEYSGAGAKMRKHIGPGAGQVSTREHGRK